MTDEELERLKLRSGLHIAIPGPDVRALIAEVERLKAELKLEERATHSHCAKIEQLRAELAASEAHRCRACDDDVDSGCR